MKLKRLKITNNNIKIKKKNVEKFYSQRERILREKYFYLKFKDKKLQIPKVNSIYKKKIIFKRYKFDKIKSQKLFFNSLLDFILRTNKEKNYKYNAKEYLSSYKKLFKQVEKKYNKINKIKVECKFLYKINIIKKYIKKIINKKYVNVKLLPSTKIISQSDIGYHNCGVYRKKVIFYDFEYAGLDNPIKLICDIYYQPEKDISKKNILLFIKKLENNFDFKITKNFLIFEKLLKVKMMLIILNIFTKSNIHNVSKKLRKSEVDKIKMDRLNKVYRYIEKPFIYE